MKKLLLFLVIASFAVLGVACSSDDAKPKELRQLVIRPNFDVNAAPVGESVTFTAYFEEGADLVKYDGNMSYFVNGVEAGFWSVFDSPGEYTVVGKAYEMKDSYPVYVTAVKKEIPGTGESEEKDYLVLKAEGNKLNYRLGESVHFDVRNQEGMTMIDADLFVSDNVRIPNPWRPTKVGTYKVVAKKLGYRSSEGLIITVY